MASPIQNVVGTVFVPVKDLEKSAAWYSDILGLPLRKVSPPVYNLEMQNGMIVTLDVDSFTSTVREGDVNPSQHGLFMLHTSDIEAAHNYLKEKNVDVEDIQRIHSAAFFHFKDPDGNKIMVYRK
jgi:catechol-2,3-dioxygenase